MGIFSRLGQLIKSNLNDLISKAEDPEKMLDQVLLEMQQQLIEAKKQVAMAIADEKRLQKQYDVESEKSREWERKAMLAVRAGNDDLAKEALLRQQEHQGIQTQYQQQWVAQKAAVDKLKDALRLLNGKIEEAKRKRNLLVARKKRAEAQRTIAATMSGLTDTSAFDTFDRMAQKIDQIEAEAEAGAEIAGALSGDSLEQRFAQLEAAGVGTEQALAALKAKMVVAGELPPGPDDPAVKPAAQLPAPAAAQPQAQATGVEGSLSPEALQKELEELDLPTEGEPPSGGDTPPKAGR